MQRVLPLLTLLLAGCLGDPDLGHVSEALTDEAPVAQVEWQRAPAGCEGLTDVPAELRPCAGEPLLGVLVGPSGRLLCVDAMSLLIAERLPRVERDPTPTPMVEGVVLDRRAL